MDETHSHYTRGAQAPPGVDEWTDALPADAVAPLRLLVLPEGRRVEGVQPMAVIGRHSAAEIRLAFPDVSRRHCRLAFEDGLWHVTDLESLNGLFVNGVRMDEATLSAGDRLRIGEATVVVIAVPAPRPEALVLRSISAALTGSVAA